MKTVTKKTTRKVKQINVNDSPRFKFTINEVSSLISTMESYIQKYKQEFEYMQSVATKYHVEYSFFENLLTDNEEVLQNRVYFGKNRGDSSEVLFWCGWHEQKEIYDRVERVKQVTESLAIKNYDFDANQKKYGKPFDESDFESIWAYTSEWYDAHLKIKNFYAAYAKYHIMLENLKTIRDITIIN